MASSPEKTPASLELERQIAELETAPVSTAGQEEIARLRLQLEALNDGADPSLPERQAWNRVLLARHPQRPYTLDFIRMLFMDFMELHGDRRFADDPAMAGGLARFEGEPVIVIGQQKGRDTKQKLLRNFGMAKPEGYRKALRLMHLGARFGLPIITWIDTPGAYPGIGAEERGQAEAIAHNLKEIPKLAVPIVVVVHGEGGSGGALGIAIGDKVMMLENAVYSVISPESCSSILWRDWKHKEEAARIMRLTAEDLHRFGLIDEVVPEPPGGAHLDPERTAATLRSVLARSLRELRALPTEKLLSRRHERLRRLGSFAVTG